MALHIFVLIAVMLMSGVFGGLVNYYMLSQYDPDTTSLPRSLVVGIGAAFLVPVAGAVAGAATGAVVGQFRDPGVLKRAHVNDIDGRGGFKGGSPF